MPANLSARKLRAAALIVSLLSSTAAATPPEHFVGKWSCVVWMSFGPDDHTTYRVWMDVERGGACSADGYIHPSHKVLEGGAKMERGSWRLHGETFICRGETLTNFGVYDLQIFGNMVQQGHIKGIFNADDMYVESTCIGAG